MDRVLESLPTGTEPELAELDRADCLRLLGTAEIGRVVFSHHAMPAAHPVAYLLDGEEIVFRTGAGSILAAATRNAVIAFQADRIDPATRSGWSVLAVGEAYEVTEPGRLAALRDRLPEPWAPGRTGHTLSLPAQHLTGRRIG